MKKILVLLTVVAIVFCSFSCKTSESAATEPEPAPAAEPAPAPAEPAPAPAAEPAPAAAEPAAAPQAAVSAEAYDAAILYLCDIDLRAKVPESKKNVEPWTKGVQIFAMGEQLYQKGMYTESLPALGQAKKFWSGLVDEKTAPVVANDEYNAKGLYYT